MQVKRITKKGIKDEKEYDIYNFINCMFNRHGRCC